jgi:hypothetical protein
MAKVGLSKAVCSPIGLKMPRFCRSWYNVAMNAELASQVVDRLVDPLSRCLTPESARRLLEFRADPELQALVDQLAEKCNEGTMTPQERSDYAHYVSFGTFVALLKSKARQLLANSPDADQSGE